MHQGVSRFVVRSCDRLDHHLHKRFFAENPHESGQTNLLTNSTIDDLKSLPNHKGSLIRLSPAIEIEEGGKIDTDLRFDAKINLPRFKERVNLVFQSEDNDKEVLEGITDQATRQRRIENEDDSLAGLRVRVLDETRFKIDLGAGTKFKPEPIPKLKARFKVSRTGAKWSFTLSEAVFWESDDGFGEKTEFAGAIALTPTCCFVPVARQRVRNHSRRGSWTIFHFHTAVVSHFKSRLQTGSHRPYRTRTRHRRVEFASGLYSAGVPKVAVF